MTNNKKILNYTLAVTLTSTVLTAAAPLMSTFVNGIFVGNMFGADAFNAINVTMPVVNLITVLTLICSMGGSVIAAKALALHNIEQAKKVFTISMLSSFMIALLSIVLLYVFMDEFAAFLCSDAASIPYLKDYMTTMLLFFLFVPFNSTLNNFVSQEGYPSLTTKIVLVTNIINIILDFVFIYCMDMGIRGAALATVIAGALNTIAYYPHFAKKKSNYTLVPLTAKDTAILRETLVQGIAFNVFYIMINGLVFFVNKLIFGLLGSTGMQIYGVCLQIQSFTFCVSVGAAIAGIAHVNKLMTQHVSQKVAYVINCLLQFTAVCFLLLLLVMTLIPETVARTFGISSPEVLSQCRMPFACFFVFYLCFAIMAVYTTISFQLMGHITAKFVFIFGLGFVVYAFMHAFSLISPQMLWWGFPVGGISMLLLSFGFGYRHHRQKPWLSRFTLVDMMPSEIIMQASIDYDGRNLPEVMQQLRSFTIMCEQPTFVFKSIELCCTEYCDYLRETPIPLAARSFDLIIRQIPDAISMTIESAGAPSCIILTSEKIKEMQSNALNLTQPEIRQEIISTLPHNVEYRYMFGLNITTMTFAASKR